MRIRVLQRPTAASVDGLRLDRFEPGFLYDVGTSLGCFLLAEGWAEPVVIEEPALLVPMSETTSSADATIGPPVRNLLRDICPPYVDDFATAADIGRRKRRR